MGTEARRPPHSYGAGLSTITSSSSVPLLPLPLIFLSRDCAGLAGADVGGEDSDRSSVEMPDPDHEPGASTSDVVGGPCVAVGMREREFEGLSATDIRLRDASSAAATSALTGTDI